MCAANSETSSVSWLAAAPLLPPPCRSCRSAHISAIVVYVVVCSLPSVLFISRSIWVPSCELAEWRCYQPAWGARGCVSSIFDLTGFSLVIVTGTRWTHRHPLWYTRAIRGFVSEDAAVLGSWKWNCWVRENVRVVKPAECPRCRRVVPLGLPGAPGCPPPLCPAGTCFPFISLQGQGGTVGSLPRSKAVSVTRLMAMFGLVPSIMAHLMQGRCTPAGSA